VKQFVFGFLFFLFSALGAQSPSWQWAQSGTCTTTDNGSAVTSDISGNVYTTGYFFGSNFTFSTTTLINAGNYDAYISKHDNSGNFLWARCIGGAYDDVSNAIVCDNSGNIFVTGYYTSSTLAIGAFTLTNLGGTDAFVVKYDPNGNVVWAKSFGDNMIEEPYGIASDGSNIFVTGQFQSNTIIFGTSTLTCNGGGDVFTAKYDNNGNEQWAKGFGDTGLEIGYGITLTPANDIYITGSFKSPSLTFNTYTLTNMGGSDYFVARYDASGNEIWAKSAGGNFDDAGTSVKMGFTGELFTTGYFRSTTISFGTSTFTNASTASADVFLANYNGLGSETWVRAYGGNLDDISYGIVCDPSGNVIIGGHIHSSSITIGSYSLICSGVGDAFLAKLNAAGNVVWAENQGGLSDDGINGIAGDPGFNILIAGFYNSSSISFTPYTLNNTGSSDLCLAKLLNPPTAIEQLATSKLQTSLYPNPASAGFTIEPLPHNAIVNIFDVNGKEILRYEVPDSPSLFIDTRQLLTGIYIVNILSDKSRQTLKLSVLH
jgi:hypothetical protein